MVRARTRHVRSAHAQRLCARWALAGAPTARGEAGPEARPRGPWRTRRSQSRAETFRRALSVTVRTYTSPEAFKQALEGRLRATSKTGAAFARRRQLLVF